MEPQPLLRQPRKLGRGVGSWTPTSDSPRVFSPPCGSTLDFTVSNLTESGHPQHLRDTNKSRCSALKTRIAHSVSTQIFQVCLSLAKQRSGLVPSENGGKACQRSCNSGRRHRASLPSKLLRLVSSNGINRTPPRLRSQVLQSTELLDFAHLSGLQTDRLSRNASDLVGKPTKLSISDTNRLTSTKYV